MHVPLAIIQHTCTLQQAHASLSTIQHTKQSAAGSVWVTGNNSARLAKHTVHGRRMLAQAKYHGIKVFLMQVTCSHEQSVFVLLLHCEHTLVCVDIYKRH